MSGVYLPYGKGNLTLDPTKYKNMNVMLQREYHSGISEAEAVREALDNPIGTQALSSLCKGKRAILLITNDMTRPMPSKITIPMLIDEIEKSNPDAVITIIIASGLHREMTKEELTDKMGLEITDHYRVLVHNAYDKDSLTFMGNLSSGNPLWLNKEILSSDLILAEGFIEPHWLAGFSGGRKSIVPGLAGADTVMNNHSPKNVDDVRTRPGNMTENPAHLEFVEAAEKAKLAFILNVVLNEDKKIIKAFAGHPVEAHEKGCAFVRELMEVECEPADITITTNSGYPLDLNLYQSCKGMDTASFATKENGVIILCSHCEEGVGHSGFGEVMQSETPTEEILDDMRSGKIKIYDQWGAQVILNLIVRFKIIMVTSIQKEIVESMRMLYAADIDEAITLAKSFCGEDPSINVIPQGPVVIVKAKQKENK